MPHRTPHGLGILMVVLGAGLGVLAMPLADGYVGASLPAIFGALGYFFALQIESAIFRKQDERDNWEAGIAREAEAWSEKASHVTPPAPTASPASESDRSPIA